MWPEVHRHGCGYMIQDPLYDLRVSSSGKPPRRRSMTQIMNAQGRYVDHRRGRTPANGSLPVRLAQRPTARSVEQPGIRRLPCAPPTSSSTSGTVPGTIVLECVHLQCAAVATGQHGMSQPQPQAGNGHAVTDLETRQLCPSQSGQREHRHHIAITALHDAVSERSSIRASACPSRRARAGTPREHYRLPHGRLNR
jgi:hypothetical protein